MDDQQARLDRLLYWLSGIVDGEGCILLTWKKYKKYSNLEPMVTVSNTDPAILNNVCFVLRELRVGFYIPSRTSRTQEVVIKGFKRVERLLSFIVPTLVGKKDEANVVINFINSRKDNPRWGYSESEIEAYQQCKDLKRSKSLRDYTPTLPEFFGQDDIVQTNAKPLEARGNYLPAPDGVKRD